MNLATTLIEFSTTFSIRDMDHPSSTQGNLKSFRDHLLARLSHLFVRNLVYKIAYDQVKPKKKTNDLSAKERGVLGGVAGMIGAMASNQFECRYVRQVGDIGRAKQFQRNTLNYNLSAGLKSNMLRAFMMNYFMLYPYETFKENCYNVFGDVWVNTPLALIGASFIASLIVLPIDTLKTRYQNVYQQQQLNRYASYKEGTMDMIAKIVQHEGGMTFWAGFSTYFLRNFIFGISTILVCD